MNSFTSRAGGATPGKKAEVFPTGEKGIAENPGCDDKTGDWIGERVDEIRKPRTPMNAASEVSTSLRLSRAVGGKRGAEGLFADPLDRKIHSHLD